MMLRTLAEIEAAGQRAGAALPPLTKAEANQVALILAAARPAEAA